MTDKPDPAAARTLCDEMAKLAEKASPGPWSAAPWEEAGGGRDWCLWGYQHSNHIGDNDLQGDFAKKEDAQFVARCREAVPALISHVRALADEVERQADQLRKMDEAFLTLNDEASALKARAELAEAERDALLLVAREWMKWGSEEMKEACAALPAARLAKVKGGGSNG